MNVSRMTHENWLGARLLFAALSSVGWQPVKRHDAGRADIIAALGECRATICADIQRGMARAFFATAWADAADESADGPNLSGCQIMDEMPAAIDPAALDAARDLVAKLAKGGETIDVVYAMNHGDDKGAPLVPETWGHYAAMQAMGHGVGLWEYGVKLPVPYVEFSQFDLSLDYFTKPAELVAELVAERDKLRAHVRTLVALFDATDAEAVGDAAPLSGADFVEAVGDAIERDGMREAAGVQS